MWVNFVFTVRELSNIFVIGGILYGLIEILFRGYTHWSMVITGGLCFLIFYIFNITLPTNSLILRCIVSLIVITTLEYYAGYIVNILLKWNVWDYSNLAYNIKGQICLTFSAIWFLFGIPMTFLANYLRSVL